MPFFIWELALGLWLTFKGFNEDSPIGLAERARRLKRDRRSGGGRPRGRGRCGMTAQLAPTKAERPGPGR